MPSLAQTLPANDLGFLRIIASFWGLDLTSADPAEAALELAEGLCDAELLEEVVSTLPDVGRTALEALEAENGRMPWASFARRFGELREMGPGKRDREHPHQQPSSAAEILWYRGLLAKAFLNGEKGPQEFAFIPDDLFMALDFAGLIPPAGQAEPAEEYLEELPEAEIAPPGDKSLPAKKDEDVPGRPASPTERAWQMPAGDMVLDDACTYLAAVRMGLEPAGLRIPVPVLREFLLATGVIKTSSPNAEAVKRFLEAPRAQALADLRKGWQASDTFNELRQLPGLAFEGGWKNQPQATREFLLNLLKPIPEGQWWSLPAFIRDVKARFPDYQRPAGDYDSWFIKREADGVFLRGFVHWDEVDGALIRYLISGPLHWLGLLDLAAPEAGATPTAFRVRSESNRLPTAATGENTKLTVTSQGRIIVPKLVSLAVRYQVARFCEIDEPKDQEYQYRVTAASLGRAASQGLKAGQLLGILHKQASGPLPPTLVKALQRWEKNGSEAQVESLVVLKVSRPEVLSELRGSKAARFLGEPLGPTTVVIQPGAQAKVMAALAELGILAERRTDEQAHGAPPTEK